MNRPAIALIFIMLLFCLFPSPATLQQDPLEKFNDTHQVEIQGAKVTRVIDGDTIEIESGSMKERVMYIGIDTPERGKPYYKEAKEYNQRIIGDNLVTLKMDVQLRDKYGRLLAYVYLEDENRTFVNATLVEEGYARVMTVSPNVKHSDLFLKLQREAALNLRGIWQSKQPVFLLSMDPTRLTAWAAVVGIIIALCALILEHRRSTFQVGVQMTLRFTDEFEIDRIRSARQSAARAMKLIEAEPKKDAMSELSEIDDILDFFEKLALLVRRKAINKRLVCHEFFYWFHRYYLLGRDRIASIQQTSPTIYEDIVWLYPRLVKFQKKQNPHFDEVLTKEELSRFIQEELDLGSDE